MDIVMRKQMAVALYPHNELLKLAVGWHYWWGMNPVPTSHDVQVDCMDCLSRSLD